MTWFDDLRRALPAYYPASGSLDIVGYLRGSLNPTDWRSMEINQHRNQMIILGNAPPAPLDWLAAGVQYRGGGDQVVKFRNLNGFIVLYGGFNRRPWGSIFILDAEGLKAFPNSILSWKQSYTPPKP
jgi:hypothetical protein